MYLEKKDASLYYEVHGEGQPLVLVHGVIVDADLFKRAAELLSRFFKVIIYDRRGNSRSRYKKENSFTMEAQAEDIRDILDALGIKETYIAGVSAGAVIGEHFLEQYPERVNHLIMYEPAMLGEMKDDPELREWIQAMMDLIERKKYSKAVLKFVEQMGNLDKRSPRKDTEIMFREMKNHTYALTREFPGLVAYRPDMEKMKNYSSKITLAAGEKSGNTIYVKTAARLAAMIGKKEIYYPGCHNLPYDLPEEFAICILGTIGNGICET